MTFKSESVILLTNLILQVVSKLYPYEVGKKFATVMFNAKNKGISFESITRHRRKFLELHPELKDEKTKQVRMEEEENYREEYSHGGYTC